MTRIFISYRRQDSKLWSDRMYPVLVKAFGKENVFKDLDSIHSGRNFLAAIEKAIIDADVILVVIGPQWASITDSTGLKRLDDPKDFVRLEVEMALRHDKTVIPVLIDGAQMPTAADLPSSMTEFPFLNAATVHSDPYFDHDMSGLIREIREARVDRPIAARGLNLPFLLSIAVGLVVLLLATFAILNRQPPVLTDTPTVTQQIVQAPIDTPTATTTLSSTEVEGTIQGEMNIAQTDNANTQSAVVALKTANAVATDARSAADKTATAAGWTLTPTLDARATALARLAETQNVINQTSTAAAWTPTPTPTLTPTSTSDGGGAGEIVFTSNRDNYHEIYVMNVDGRNIRKLTNDIAIDDSPAWSPYGTRIIYRSYRNLHYNIYVINADGTGSHNLTNNGFDNSSPAWSPDRTKIAYYSQQSGNNYIYVMNTDGTNNRQLTQSGKDSSPAWSPDGRQIIFSSTRQGDNRIYIMNSDGSNQRQLISRIINGSLPVWSPDGSKIAFVSRQITNQKSNQEIYVVNADGTDPHNVTNNAADDTSPAWSPDSSQISFRSDRSGNWEIYVMDANGSNLHNISNNSAMDGYPNWRPAAPNPDPLLTVPTVTP